jgi:hypothetical protein
MIPHFLRCPGIWVRRRSVAGNPGLLRPHPGAAVEQLARRVEVAGVDRGLGDDVQDDLPHVTQPPAAEVVRPPGRRRVQAEPGQDRVGGRYLPPVKVEDGPGGLAGRRLPAGVVVEGERLARRDGTDGTRTARRRWRGGAPAPGTSSPTAAPAAAGPPRKGPSGRRARGHADRPATPGAPPAPCRVSSPSSCLLAGIRHGGHSSLPGSGRAAVLPGGRRRGRPEFIGGPGTRRGPPASDPKGS